MAALLAAVGLVGAAGTDDLSRAVAAEAGTDRLRPALLGRGLVAGPAAVVLVGAPAAYVVARAMAIP